jgi:HAE1 family hydrophobic/amphiphilic exporter-1
MILSEVAVRRPVFTTMVMCALTVFGWVSLRRLGVDLMPRVEFPFVTIITYLPGADPETVESRVSDPIEEAVNTLSGIKHLRSTSADSYSLVSVEFELDKKIDVAFQEVQARVRAIRGELPTDAEEPVIEKLDVDAQPILTVVVSGDLPPRELSHLADKTIKERLQRVRNVGSCRLVGKRERKIWLWLNPEKLTSHVLTVQDVRSALRREHIELPGGRVETGPLELAVRTKAEFQSAAELNQLVIVQRGAGAVRLQDVGYAEDGLEELRSYAQLDDQPGIALQVRRQSGTNTVQVARDVKAEVERLKAEFAPRVRLVIAQDHSVFIERSVSEVKFHLVEGGGMAVLVVLLFLLNFRSTVISALVLPTSVISTFMMMSAMGFTVNMMTLLGLTLAIGLLIDDSIVVQENTMRHVEAGKPPREAALFATNEIGLAVFATTMSVVAVFVPVAYTEGIVGRFFFPFAVTVAFAVLISMFVSFTLDPMLSSRFLRKPPTRNVVFRVLEWLFQQVEHVYEKLLGLTLRARYLVVLLAIGIFVFTFALRGFLHFEFVPMEDAAEFNVMVRAPLGASVERTREVMEKIRGVVKEIPEANYVLYTIGADELKKVNEGSLYVRLKEKHERTRSQKELMELVRAKVAGISDAKVSVQMVPHISGGGMKWAEVQFELRGKDLAVLNSTAARLTDRLRQKAVYEEPGAAAQAGRSGPPVMLAGYVDLDTTFETGKPELDVVLDRERAVDAGVTPEAVAETVRAAIGGVEIGKFRAEGDRYDISVRFLEQYRNSAEGIESLLVPSTRGAPRELRGVAHVVRTAIPVEIARHNRQRQVTVLANLHGSKKLGDAKDDITQIMREIGLPPGYSSGWAGFGEEMGTAIPNLLFTMMLSVIVVYMVLASQFESFIHPFTIMLSLPLAFTGALGALILTGLTVSIFSMIAFIFLLGLVTKNAILLIDYTNTLRERDGLARDDALRRAGPVRLRPILMTTFAMIFGMLPVALGAGSGAESRQPMAVAIVGGLVSSTLLTLLVVPAVYSLLDQAATWVRRRLSKDA